MSILLERLSKRLIAELGLVAHVDENPKYGYNVHEIVGGKIDGGTVYEDLGYLAFYQGKYDIWMVGNTYALSLPLGQTRLELFCDSEDEAMEIIRSHYSTYYPEHFTKLNGNK